MSDADVHQACVMSVNTGIMCGILEKKKRQNSGSWRKSGDSLTPLIKSGSFASASYRCGKAKQIVLQRPVDDCGSLPRAGLSGAPPRLLSPVPAERY